MNNRLCAYALLPLMTVVVVPVVYYTIVAYFSTEQRIACTLTQTTHIPYWTINSVILLLFFIAVLAIAITKMCHCTFSCLHTVYVARQEHTSKEQNDPAV